MDQNLLIAVMAGFVIISAIALCIQAGLLFGIYKAAKAMSDQTTALLPQTKSILGQASNLIGHADTTVQEGHRQLVDLGVKAVEIADSAKLQMLKIDSLVSNSASRIDLLVTDATARAHNQLEKVELVVDDTVGRVHETVGAVHNGLLAPVRQINGLAAGAKAAVGVFLKGGRPNVAEATQQDEMFI
jgi:hypothetical protein